MISVPWILKRPRCFERREPIDDEGGQCRQLVRARAEPRPYGLIDITAITLSGHVTSSLTSPFDSPWLLSYRLPIVANLLPAVVSEMFSVKDGHWRVTPTKRHPGTHPSHTAGEFANKPSHDAAVCRRDWRRQGKAIDKAKRMGLGNGSPQQGPGQRPGMAWG